MPDSVEKAAASEVLAYSLCRAFAHSRQYPLVENEYRNGESQRALVGTTSRKSWRLAKRLKPTALQALRDFYLARKGPQEAFYFYDPWETDPKFSHDPTGVAMAGRYTVRFASAWEQVCGPGRADVQIELIELA